MLVIDNLTIGYDDRPVLSGLTISIEAGKIHGLVGLNGQGKTTLLNVISGKLEPWTGSVLWDGKKPGRSDLALLETEPWFYPKITGREYLKVMAFHNQEANIDDWNDWLTLPLDDLTESYSSGMKKKLAIMGTFLRKTPLVLLDEPFNNLDLEAVARTSSLLTRMKESGRTILVTSHILGSLTGICDKIHDLYGGTIRHSFSPDEFDGLEDKLVRNRIEKAEQKLEKLS